ncbi:MAG: menaquinone biosynthetic enzyme MqnA/MqnD family protein [Longimicrobiales bacterium]
MIRLGHILYSNCFPVHARFLDEPVPSGIELVPGVPAELNEQLGRGLIDVAPCSSIEYARHAGDYNILPGLAIASAGPVQSILLETTIPPEHLDGRAVLVPTVSATSIVLLRILFERRFRVKANLRWFDQSRWDALAEHPHPRPLPGGEGDQSSAAGAAGEYSLSPTVGERVRVRGSGVSATRAGPGMDPLDGGAAAAALWIGDVALRRVAPAGRQLLDLGAMWAEWTGLPFAYAVWQARAGVDTGALNRLHCLLLESRSWFESHVDALARRHASRFGIDAGRLAPYWRSLRYTLDDETERGLLHFYRLAAELGEATPVEALRWACANRG